MRQFFLETDPSHPPRPGDTVTLDRDESHHLFTVLRGGRENQLDLVDGRGLRMTGLPAAKDGKLARIKILSVEKDEQEIREPRLVLACAVVKGKRFEWALEKAVELGAHEIQPLVTDLGVIDPRPGKQERWRGVLIAALKQCGRAWLPELRRPVNLAAALERRPDDPVYCGAAPGDWPAWGESPISWVSLNRPSPSPLPGTLTMLVGPEGGWSPAELELMASVDRLIPVGLGPHILRTETAAVAGMTVLQTLRDRVLTAP